MAIVLKENDWANTAIASLSLGENKRETLRRVARYYIDSGLTPSAAEKKTETFLLSCSPETTPYDASKEVSDALKCALKRPALEIDSIDITATELEKINALNSRQAKRLAFTLLCLAKYNDASRAKNDHWVNMADTQIMKMANISTSLRRQGLLYWTLREAGLVQFSKKIDSLGTRVLFIDGGEPVIHITDFRSLGYQYQMYLGEPYFVCENCGVTVKQNNQNNKGRQKYCKECAFKIRMKQNIDSVMKLRDTKQPCTVGN